MRQIKKVFHSMKNLPNNQSTIMIFFDQTGDKFWIYFYFTFIIVLTDSDKMHGSMITA